MKQITEAIIAVMDEVTNIEKKMSVGTGNSSYKAVSDSMVRSEIKNSMLKNGLIIVPTLFKQKQLLTGGMRKLSTEKNQSNPF